MCGTEANHDHNFEVSVLVGPGLEVPEAFSKNCGKESLLWINPPVPLLEQVVENLERQGKSSIDNAVLGGS